MTIILLTIGCEKENKTISNNDKQENKVDTSRFIDEIIFSIGANKKVFIGPELLEYFKPNKFIELDTISKRHNRKSIDRIYDPFIICININNIVSNLF